MTATFKSILGICLAALMAMTSQSMALSRGASAAMGQMVICTGTGPVTVYVDANGAPTTAPHVCDDCIIALTGVTPDQHFALSLQKVAGHLRAPFDCHVEYQHAVLGFHARAPPYTTAT